MSDNLITSQLSNDGSVFEFEKFDFLLKTVSQNTRNGFNGNHLRITCFDINDNYFIFGTNIGSIYSFKRHQKSGNPFLKYQLISSPINLIKIISDELLSFVSDSGVYLINWSNQRFLYGWKCPTHAIITCLNAFMSITDEKLILLSGDSDGCVRYHDVIECQQNNIYQEIGFHIIQIEFIDCQTLLISSSLKSVIIKTNFNCINDQSITQIGKNERKSYGKYGAVYGYDSDVIYGSRPSLHLIKAQLNGNVIETIRLNNINPTQSVDNLEEFSKITKTKVNYKLGILSLFCSEQYIISWNESNLVIIGTDGQFCMKEKVENLIDVKISNRNSNEAFLLLESKYVIRIRNRHLKALGDFDDSNNYEIKGFDCKESIDQSYESKSSTESLINLIKRPISVRPISFIDEELKKAFDKIQVKVTKKFDELSASIISTIDANILSNSNQNVFVTPVYDNEYSDENEINDQQKDNQELSPLLVKTVGKRKTNAKKALNRDKLEEMVTCDANTDSRTLNNNSSQSVIEELEKEELEKLNDENKLAMILSAYKRANNIPDIPYEEQQSIETEFFYSTQMSDPVFQNNISSDNTDGVKPENIIHKSDKCIEQTSTDDNPLEYEWKSINDLSDSFVSFCGSGYDSCTETGLIWFITKNKLMFYPSFNEIKLTKAFAIQISGADSQLYVLTDNGLVLKREGMDATIPVGKKWSNIKVKNKCRLTSISLNTSDSILWFCDINGETYTLQLKTQKWSKINDFTSHSIEMKKVCVSVENSSIVWGIDKSGKIFVRIFETSGDSIDGNHWQLIDGVLALDLVVCNDNRVWIAVEGNRLYRRNARICGNTDYDNRWQAVIGPNIENDSYVSITCTQNNEIWILTAKGNIYHSYDSSDSDLNCDQMRETVNDWLLINV